MGSYPSKCSRCDKQFMWFSGNDYQICPDCVHTAGGIHTIEQKLKKQESLRHPSGYLHFVDYNEADTPEAAIDYLVEKGLPRDELSIRGSSKAGVVKPPTMPDMGERKFTTDEDF